MNVLRLDLKGRSLDLTPPEAMFCPPEGLSPSTARTMAGFWSRYGGAIMENAQRFALAPHLALAVMYVEAGSEGAFDTRTGRVVIRVEARPPILGRKRFPNGEAEFKRRYGHGRQAEWAALIDWAAREGETALSWTSFGVGQIMGFNFRAAGLRSPAEVLLKSQKSAQDQINMFFVFVANQGLLEPLRAQAWRTFAGKYNGPGQVDHYAGRLAETQAMAAGVCP